MTEYIVVVAALGVPTGKENPLTRLPDVVRFRRGEVVDTAEFDTKQGRNKIERLLRQGALRDPDDIPAQAKAVFKSEFDIPLDRDPGGVAAETPGIVKLPGDDLDDDEQDAGTWPPQPSLVSGTPESRLQGTAVNSADTDGTHEELADTDGDGHPEPPSRGASTAVWQQYARRIDLPVSENATRTEIQEAYDAQVAGTEGD